MRSSLLIALLMATGPALAFNKVIYGIDNRLDLFETDNAHYLELASSTAAMIPNYRIVDDGTGGYVMSAAILGASQRLCKDEKFYNQPTAANCSGFLVGPDLLVTAGHCMKSQSNCDSSSWVFNYGVSDESQGVNRIEKSDIYKCAKIIETKLSSDQNDYALIQLDRQVEGRLPLAVRTSGKIEKEATLLMIGHPTGLPTKIAPDAGIRNNDHPLFFKATTDSFGGNSGSAVFNQDTGVVEGILVRGERDYAYDSVAKCYRVNYCPEGGCRAEDVTRITNVTALMKILENN